MSLILPAVVIAEAGIIFWLLASRAVRSRVAPSLGGSAQANAASRNANPSHADAAGSSAFAAVRAAAADATSHLCALARLPAGWRASRPSSRPGVTASPPVAAARQKPVSRGARARHPLKADAHVATPCDVEWTAAAHRAAFSGVSGSDSLRKPYALRRGNAEEGWGEDSFHDLWESMPLGILILDEHGTILVANAPMERLSGYSSRALLGQPISMVIKDLCANGEGPAQGLLSAISKMPACESERNFVARRSDGADFPVKVHFRASSFGNEPAILAFIEDRTDHYELLRNQQELAHLARVSTMGELAGSLAHELNQPLTAILSNVQAAQRFMAADPIDVAEVREILDDIVQDDYRASEVIRRIRAVLRKGELEFAPVDLATVIRDVVLLLRSDAIMRAIRITLELDDTLPAVYADKVQLQQVTLNLLLNAFDAMNGVAPAERTVSITLTREGGDMACIAIRDCGHGFTPGKLDTLFKPFYTTKPHGLGLGLSISRSIVELHGGRLWAENNTDRGATFHVTLPTRGAAQDRQSR